MNDQPVTATTPRNFTVRSLATHWGVSPNHIYNLIHSNALRHMRIGKAIRIPNQFIKEFEEAACLTNLTSTNLNNAQTVSGIQPQFSMPVKAPPPKDLWLTREQVALLIEKAKSPHISLFIKLAVSTAARSGAILELTWDRVDFEMRLIDLGQGHGNKRRSIVPMHDQVYEALMEAKELRQTDFVIEFMGKSIKSIKKSFRILCKECGVKASPHVLRHTAATWMVMAGVPLSEVARMLGDSERTVERVYSKHAPDYLRRAVSALNFKPSLNL